MKRAIIIMAVITATLAFAISASAQNGGRTQRAQRRSASIKDGTSNTVMFRTRSRNTRPARVAAGDVNGDGINVRRSPLTGTYGRGSSGQRGVLVGLLIP